MGAATVWARARGTATYADGSWYDGYFVSNKYHGRCGVYRWPNGNSYDGEWVDGERHGIGTEGGGITYSVYDMGLALGDGVGLDAERKAMYGIVDRRRTKDMSIKDAETTMKEKVKFVGLRSLLLS